MKKRNLIFIISILVVGILAGRYLIPSNSAPAHDHAAMETAATKTEATKWTCSMHPIIQQPSSGACPICGMDLIPLATDDGADLGPRMMSMSESSLALAEIQTTAVRQDFPVANIRLVGQLDYDQTKVKSLTARFPARIEQLFVNFTGVRVKRGEHLAEVYSPELLTAQRELITAYQRDPNGSITAAAREKLHLWDLLPDQIDSIIASGEAKDRFELRAPISGIVVMKKVNEGEYVKTGESLFKIVDLSELWLNLDAYESDLFWLRYGQSVEFTVEAYPGETFSGPIAFIEPEFDRKTRTVAVRVNIANAEGRLKPGMFARGIVRSRIAEDGQVYAPDFSGKWICGMHPEVVKPEAGACDLCGMDLVPAEQLGYVSDTVAEAPLLVPSSAVLRTGKRAVVYVEVPNTERPTFEGREIVLGPKAGDEFMVTSGLELGERVVTKGAFKIDSALQIQAKPSMMSPPAEAEDSMVMVHPSITKQVVSHYFDLQAALAADDLAGSQAALKAMMGATGHTGEVADLIHTMLNATDLDGLRRPHFETLSKLVIAAVKADPSLVEDEAYLMNCSMVYPDHGADWLQNDAKLMNPYFGAMMLHCGEVKGKIN
jgi:Cu(I)/Ag(I) efflux system membrane fusion protein